MYGLKQDVGLDEVFLMLKPTKTKLKQTNKKNKTKTTNTKQKTQKTKMHYNLG